MLTNKKWPTYYWNSSFWEVGHGVRHQRPRLWPRGPKKSLQQAQFLLWPVPFIWGPVRTQRAEAGTSEFKKLKRSALKKKQLRSGICFFPCSKEVKHCQTEICCVPPNSFPSSCLLPGGVVWGAENTLTLYEHCSAIVKHSWIVNTVFSTCPNPVLATTKKTNSIAAISGILAGFPSVFRSPGSQPYASFLPCYNRPFYSICRSSGKEKGFLIPFTAFSVGNWATSALMGNSFACFCTSSK